MTRQSDAMLRYHVEINNKILPWCLSTNLLIQQCKIQDPSFLDCMTSSKLYRNRKQNFHVLQPNVNCVTLAAGCSTPQVYNVNWVVPPAGYIPQKWGGDMSLPAPMVAPPMIIHTVIAFNCSYSTLELRALLSSFSQLFDDIDVVNEINTMPLS